MKQSVAEQPGAALPYRSARARATVFLGARGFLAVVVLAVCATLLTPPSAAGAAERREVSGGRLDWGIKSSFQTYVTGPIAHGGWELRGGAATVGSNQFRFHSAKGSHEPDTGNLDAAFSGGVHFTGHRKPDGSYELDLTIANPAVSVRGDGGTLYADMTSKARGTGKVTSRTRVPLATLDLTGTNLRGAGTAVSLTNVPAKLTTEGAESFAGFYQPGTQLDPLSLSADITANAASSPSPSGGAPSGGGGEKPAEQGRFTGAAVDWGIRRTFREYVTGSIARGSWKLADGAREGGALFRFPEGKGAYEGGGTALEASFGGTLRFTGKDLDLALTGVEVAVKEGKGTLSAEVTRGPLKNKRLPLVTFDASKLRQKDGLVSVAEAPARLTGPGAEAFGGLYQEGAEMDPVSLAVPVTAGAKLPELPNVGRDPGASPAPSASASASGEDTSSSSSATTALAAGGGGVVILAAVGYVVVRARRKRDA
ncbi:HtaA domain-containing protein [Streptomyces sp. I05A-00742]|uniref:HtaA domain-containing protein n=1 Tax=Streptomyces sp. I05A-00742 TaxID=2732853 RepID=UPI001488ECCD|nr:HtaA domain-containing protein [Streptomyces sp. I05A-00742]